MTEKQILLATMASNMLDLKTLAVGMINKSTGEITKSIQIRIETVVEAAEKILEEVEKRNPTPKPGPTILK